MNSGLKKKKDATRPRMLSLGSFAFGEERSFLFIETSFTSSS